MFFVVPILIASIHEDFFSRSLLLEIDNHWKTCTYYINCHYSSIIIHYNPSLVVAGIHDATSLNIHSISWYQQTIRKLYAIHQWSDLCGSESSTLLQMMQSQFTTWSSLMDFETSHCRIYCDILTTHGATKPSLRSTCSADEIQSPAHTLLRDQWTVSSLLVHWSTLPQKGSTRLRDHQEQLCGWSLYVCFVAIGELSCNHTGCMTLPFQVMK